MEPKGSGQLIRAEVPQVELLDYDATLTSMTGGRGSYHMEFDHYAEVPSHLQEKIISAHKALHGEHPKEEA
jgi:elongation factor G